MITNTFSIQSLSRVRLFATPWIAACQASLSITNSQSLLKLMPIEWVMPPSHLILCQTHFIRQIMVGSPKFSQHNSEQIFASLTSVSVTQSCLTLCNPMDYSPPGSSVHGILQARILECTAMPFSRESSWPKDQAWISALQADSLPSEPPGKP